MAVIYEKNLTYTDGFFNSERVEYTEDGIPQGDKARDAEFMAEYFSSFIGNGVFPNPSTNYQISASSGMTVVRQPGKAWAKGYFCYDPIVEYTTFTTETVPHDYYHVLRLDAGAGEIRPLWYIDPDLEVMPERSPGIHELVVAKITIPADTEEITNAMITDLRYDPDMCGIVAAAVDNIDTTHLSQQIDAYLNDLGDWINEQEQNTLNWQVNQQDLFTQWFDDVKGQLSTDPAGHLEVRKANRMYAVCETAELDTAKIVEYDGYTLEIGQYIAVKFVNAVPAGSTLKIGMTADLPIVVDDDQPVGIHDIPAGWTALFLYNGANYYLINDTATQQLYHKEIFDESGTFTVPSSVRKLYISGCGAGGADNGLAGQYIYRNEYDVTPGQIINYTIGMGNTEINIGGEIIVLQPGIATTNMSNMLIGYPAGYGGGGGYAYDSTRQPAGVGGVGGAFGYGGGGHGWSGTSYRTTGGGGGGCDLVLMTGSNGQNGANSGSGGVGGGTTGGGGGINSQLENGNGARGRDAGGGEFISNGSEGIGINNGGRGTRYGGGGGGAMILSTDNNIFGGGGGAGGYGAGGGEGYDGAFGEPTGGVLIFEWGALYESLPNGQVSAAMNEMHEAVEKGLTL